jgi:hypothetical protein
MFGRQVTMRLKEGAVAEFNRITDSEILPLLRKQKGFRDETILIAPERAEVIASSFWDSKEDAEAYGGIGYPEVLKALTNVIEGTPTVKTFDSARLTVQQAATARLS